MVVLNLGGIANLSIFSRTGELTCGFDTGPANAPLDRLARIYSQSKKSYDKDGAIAKRADLDIGLLNKLLASDQYIRRDPPKSTGFEMYGDEWVVNLLKKTKNDAAVAIRIALEFSIEAIKKSLILHCPDFTSATVIVAGGGTQNKFYIERLKQMLSPAKVLISDEVGVPWNAREAMSFALLANDCICGVPTSLPIVTGATRQAILGKISLP